MSFSSTNLSPMPTMLAAPQPNGPATFVAINNMFSASSIAQLPNNNTLLSVPTGLGLASPAAIGPGSFVIPSSNFPPNPNNLTCTIPPAQLQNPFLPFFGSNSLSVPISQYVQPSTPLVSTFPSSSSTLISSHQLSTSIIQPPNNTIYSSPLPVSSTILSTQSPIMLPTIPVSFTNSQASSGLIPLSASDSSNTLASTAPIYTATLFSVGNSTLITPKIPNNALPLSVSSTTTPSASLATTIKMELKESPTPPVTVTPTSISSATPSTSRLNAIRNLQVLEAADFHRDAILDAIDKLRDRKARPDFERISCLLKRYQNINPEQTQLCLSKLADAGAVVCVDYKGNLSYRNPSKWRKTAAISGSGMSNFPNVSQRLVDALRLLMESSTSNATSGTATLVPPPQPGPNGGFTLFQIERALQHSVVIPDADTKTVLDLSGATLRVCLDRESTHGRLAKLPDGRFVLDESGERKRLNSTLNTSSSNNSGVNTQLLQKKALLPNGNSTLSSAGTLSKFSCKSSSFGTAIAPADPNRFQPLAVKQSNNVSIAPGISGKPVNLSSLQNLSVRPQPTTGRRGRPPGSKAKKNMEGVVEKKQRTELPLKDGLVNSDTIDRNSTVTIGGDSTNATFVHSTPNPFLNGFLPYASCTLTGTTLPLFEISTPGYSTLVASRPPQPTVLAAPNFPQMPIDSVLMPSSFVSFNNASNNIVLPPTNSILLPSVSDVLLNPISPAIASSKTSEADSMATPTTLVDSFDMSTPADETPAEGVALCCKCHKPAEFHKEEFLHCQDCGLDFHPRCLDYWPELSERARKMPWQCADCKTCTVCENKNYSTELVVCDACDLGFHIECHQPRLNDSIDRSLPWVCSNCEKDGYRVVVDNERVFIDPVDITDFDLLDDSSIRMSGSDFYSTDENKTGESGSWSDYHESDQSSLNTTQEQTNSCPVLSSNNTASSNTVTSTATVHTTAVTSVHTDTNNDNCTQQPENATSNRESLNVTMWSVDHVKQWLLDLGYQREAESFSQQEIDGTCLLLMRRMDVLTELGIKLGPAVKIYERIRRLQAQCTSPVG